MATTEQLAPGGVLIFGGTGTIGKYITGAILSAQPPVAQQVSIFTSPATASDPTKQDQLSAWKAQGLRVIEGDLRDAAQVTKAYEGIDTVVSALGRDTLLEQIELLKLAEAEGSSVRWFFPSEYGTDVEYDASSAVEKPHQNKLAVRAFIRENLRKIKTTHVVTGPYIDMFFRLKAGAEAAGGFDIESKRAVVIGDGNGPVGFTSMPDVGKFVAAALRHPEASRGKVLRVQSFATSPNAILQELETQTGGAKWEAVEHSPLDELREKEKKAWEAGSPHATHFTLRRIWGEGKTIYEKTDNETLGVRDSDLEPLGVVVERAVLGKGY